MIRFSSLRGSRDDRAAVRATGQVLEEPAALDLELDVVDRVVQRLVSDRAGAVDRVEVERRRAEVASLLRVRRLRESRGRVEGDVVVEELAEECRPGRLRRGCSGCSRSATGRRSAASALPPAGRSHREAHLACRARPAQPRPERSARRTAAAGRSDRSDPCGRWRADAGSPHAARRRRRRGRVRRRPRRRPSPPETASG